MTIGETVSRLRNNLKEFQGDSRLTNRFLWNIAWTVGKLLIYREKNAIYKLNIFKTVTLETEEVNLLEDTCVPLNCMGCRVKLPEGIDDKYGFVYRFIASPDMSKTWKIVTPNNYQNKQNIRSKGNYAFIDNDYIILDDCPPCIKISYLPDSSEDAISSTDSCSILEQDSNLPDYLLDNIFRMSIEELSLYMKIPFDSSTNKSTVQ